MITVKKSVLDNFIQTIVESRSDENSYADMTGTMFDSMEEEPIKPVEMMANQLTVEAPPVDDPEYVPGTKGELGRAAQLIADEVPEDQIEKVYRQLHKILDSALDRHNDANMTEELYESLQRLLESGHDDDEMEGDAADQWLKQQAALGVDIDADTADDTADDFGGGEPSQTDISSFGAGTVGDAIVQAKKLGDENVEQIKQFEDLYKNLRQKGITKPAKVDIRPAIDQRLRAVKRAADLAYTDEEIPDELKTLADAALQWEFNSEEAPAYIDAVFLMMYGVFEVNYQMIVANHGLEYGGMEIKEKDTGFGKKLDIGVKEPGTIGSPSHYAGIMEDLERRYGITYNTLINANSVYNLTQKKEDKSILDERLFKIIKGLNTFHPIFREALTKYSSDIGKTGEAGMRELAVLLRMSYEYDIEQEEVLVDQFITTYFAKIRVKDYYNLTKFTYHAWKDAESIKEDYPQRILDKMKTTKFYKAGVFKVAHPNIPNKTKDFTEEKMLEAIKTYVDAAVTASIDFHESQIMDQEAKEGDYEPSPEEAAKKRVAREIKQLEKEANPTRYTHIAPLYGFSGESGLRQWVLKFPERKMRLMRLGKNTANDFPGAAEFVKITDEIYDVVMRNLPLYLNFLKNEEQAEIFTKAFFNLRTKDKKLVGDIGDLESVRAQMDEFIRIFNIAKQNLRQINDTAMQMDTGDIGIVASALENEEPVPFERLDPILFDPKHGYTEEEIVDLVKAHQDGMYSIGGTMARSAVGEILSDIITKTDKPWKMKIADMLEQKFETFDRQTAESKAEHFMGKKNIPDFSKPNSSKVKEFADIGIGEKEFYLLYADAIKLYDDIINAEIGKQTANVKSLLSKLRKAEIEGIMKKNEAQQLAILDAAHDTYPFIIAMGIKNWDDMQRIEDELDMKKKQAEALKSQSIDEVKALSKFIERLL